MAIIRCVYCLKFKGKVTDNERAESPNNSTVGRVGNRLINVAIDVMHFELVTKLFYRQTSHVYCEGSTLLILRSDLAKTCLEASVFKAIPI